MTSCHKMTGDHLPQKTMEQVLYDVSLAESYSSYARDNNHIMGSKNTDSLAVFYKQIFEHYHITGDDFNQSMTWYKAHPDDLDSLYNHILTRIGKVQTADTGKVQ